jgi:hypothetical protein
VGKNVSRRAPPAQRKRRGLAWHHLPSAIDAFYYGQCNREGVEQIRPDIVGWRQSVTPPVLSSWLSVISHLPHFSSLPSNNNNNDEDNRRIGRPSRCVSPPSRSTSSLVPCPANPHLSGALVAPLIGCGASNFYLVLICCHYTRIYLESPIPPPRRATTSWPLQQRRPQSCYACCRNTGRQVLDCLSHEGAIGVLGACEPPMVTLSNPRPDCVTSPGAAPRI